MASPIAVIAGVGAGTGASVARRFAKAYPVVLLARNPESYQPLVDEINKSGGKAIGIPTDVTNPADLKNAHEVTTSTWGPAPIAAAVFNAGGPFLRKPLLDITPEEFSVHQDISVKGAFNFAQAVLPGLLANRDTNPPHPPTLIFTGATASVKANPLMSAFASSKHALRALTLSIAKEFGPKGVHVAHAIIDGVIDIPKTRAALPDMPLEAKIDPDAIAETYWQLHAQSVRGFVNEIDIRPAIEKW